MPGCQRRQGAKGAKGAEAPGIRLRTPKRLEPGRRKLIGQLDELEKARKNGKLKLPDGDTLDVTNLQKVFWPGPSYTKGDLLRLLRAHRAA